MQLSSLEQKLLATIAPAFTGRSIRRIGVAVSGGSDSVALLHLMALWAKAEGIQLEAVTVDHQLRSDAKLEAQEVAKQCKILNIPHSTLRWQGWDGKGNTQDQARRARYKLMADWGRERGVCAIALGHTINDQAETFLMRLARGAGVDGLSGMAQNHTAYQMEWVRPVLTLKRAELRSYLQANEISWIDDPSNQDAKYQRVKIRQALEVLQGLGLSASHIAATTQRLRAARQMLEKQTQIIAKRICRVQSGDVLFERQGFQALDPEYRLRLLGHALCWVSSADYRPRRKSLTELDQTLMQDRPATLHGCRVLTGKTEIRFCREYQAVKTSVCPTDKIWDNRWLVSGQHADDLEIRALGETGLNQCPDWRNSGFPRVTLLATPAIWQKQALIAAPMAGMGKGWRTSVQFGLEHFISSIISH